ncbi:MAG: hypothetical protein E8D43_00605 [Nitrospira sp.]|nr:MAG: hypothetical protein E8D43_00605 [Nitrospira sp.]
MESKKIDGELVKYLPVAYQEDAATRDFLLAFEKILLGPKDGIRDTPQPNIDRDQLGLEQMVNGLANYFDPRNKELPKEFLLWLGQWVALSLRLDMSEEIRGNFIAQMPQLYRNRGTKKSMEHLLLIFTGTQHGAEVQDQFDGEPHFFTVRLNLNTVRKGERKEDYDLVEEKAHSVIRAEKPAHTRYRLIPVIDTMRIGKLDVTKYSIQIGKNTRLGIARWKTKA